MIPFNDLQSQQSHISDEIDRAIKTVLDHGIYIMGPEVKMLEDNLSNFTGAKHSVTCSNGTDALTLFLRAKNIGAGDAVLLPSFTFIATAEVVSLIGATPIFLDVNGDNFNLNPDKLNEGYNLAKEKGLNPVGVITVDLFGQPADYDCIQDFCKNKKLWLLSDGAQSFGASYKGKKVGTIGDASTTSFFPAKPLGCYGDGGAIFTDNCELAEIIHSLRVHGKGKDKYDNVRVGYNARIDTIQAAILIEKLKIFPKELIARQKLADKYTNSLNKYVSVPILKEGCTSSWAQYTLKIQVEKRDEIVAILKDNNIPTVVYYPIPLHKQKAYNHYPHCNPVTAEKLSHEVLSLPMHAYMDDKTSDYIIENVIKALSK